MQKAESDRGSDERTGGESWSNPPAEPLASEWKTKGVEHRTYFSQSMQRDVGYCISFPPGYSENSQRFPVVYYLHGRGGTESMNLQAFGMLFDAVAAGQVPPIIHVHAFGGRQSNFADSYDRKMMGETTIIKELIPHIDAKYRTRAHRGGRAIQGFSMGGQGALRLGIQYPELFGSVVGFASGVVTGEELRAEGPEVFRQVHNDDVKAFDQTSFWAWLYKNADKIRGKLGILHICGDKDPHTERNRKLHRILTELELPHEFTEVPGLTHDLSPAMPGIGVQGLQFHARYFSENAAF